MAADARLSDILGEDPDGALVDAKSWIELKVGRTPTTSVGWFRSGVGFFNKRWYTPSIQCLQKAVEMDPLNYNAFQVLARAYLHLNRKEEAIAALRESVKLNNASDWQLLVELTSSQQHAHADTATATAPTSSSSTTAAAPVAPAAPAAGKEESATKE